MSAPVTPAGKVLNGGAIHQALPPRATPRQGAISVAQMFVTSPGRVTVVLSVMHIRRKFEGSLSSSAKHRQRAPCPALVCDPTRERRTGRSVIEQGRRNKAAPPVPTVVFTAGIGCAAGKVKDGCRRLCACIGRAGGGNRYHLCSYAKWKNGSTHTCVRKSD